MFRFAVAILAAGASSRMGQPKLLLPWNDTSVVAALIHGWRDLGAAHIALVLSPNPGPLAEELDRLGIGPTDRIVNPQQERGMFSSVQCAAQWTGWRPELTHYVLTLGDQPHVRPATLRALVGFAAAHPLQVCQPSRLGRPRHPVILPAPVWQRLAGSPRRHLKEFLSDDPGERVCMESDDEALDFDLDEPADYERALRLARGRELSNP